MTREEIIELAHAAGWPDLNLELFAIKIENRDGVRWLKEMNAAVAEERKRCRAEIKKLRGTQKLQNISYMEGWDDAIDAAMGVLK
jgi:hypothetical protein